MLPLTPRIIVNANGSPVNGMFYQRLTEATITDVSGQQSDSLTCTFENRGNTIPLPEEGDVLEPFFGFRETGITTMGKFEVDGWSYRLGPSGEYLVITAKSANLRENQKEKGSEHFEDTTLGDMLKATFGRVGADIHVDDELASIAIEYEARFDQSSLDFATRLADRFGAIFKPGPDGFLFVPRGSQKMISGGTMQPIILNKRDTDTCEINGKPRAKYGRVAAKWHNPATGKTAFETEETGGDGPIRTLKNSFKTQAEAKAAAKAEATKQNRGRADGHFERWGLVTATAEVDVIATGFGQSVDGLWRSDQVEQTFRAGNGGGFKTRINVKAPETPRA